ncbi:MAG: dTDP-glucose 4,6-dehydratase [Mariprofundaceae bacterium]|nr:dTDP-glucose 4,6-dehydratase [Mariprofundaceae bacterium]
MTDYKPKNILVTGGAGFIGCNYVRYMLATDAKVKIVNLDALTYAGSLDNLKDLPDESRHTFVQGDICDRELVDKLMRDFEIDTVVHFAAESHVDNSISGPEIFVKTNVMGTFTLLDSARQYWQGEKNWDKENCRFHHISTDEVYGTLEATDSAFSETTPYAPNSPYSASKAGSDHLVRAYFHTYGLPVTTTNCSNNYGSYQHGEKFIPTVIRKCLEQESIPVYGDGTNIRDWLYVTDHCSGIDVVVRKGELGEVYNIGGINEWANIDICKLICQLMDEHKPGNAPHEKLITFVQDRAGHDWRYAIDATKMADKLGWKPAETFETGIRKSVAWYLESQSNMSPHG